MQNVVFVDETTITGDGTIEHPLSAIASGATPGGLDMEIQFNDAGDFGGATDFLYDKTAQTLQFTPSKDTAGFSVNPSNTSGDESCFLLMDFSGGTGSQAEIILSITDGSKTQSVNIDPNGINLQIAEGVFNCTVADTFDVEAAGISFEADTGDIFLASDAGEIQLAAATENKAYAGTAANGCGFDFLSTSMSIGKTVSSVLGSSLSINAGNSVTLKADTSNLTLQAAGTSTVLAATGGQVFIAAEGATDGGWGMEVSQASGNHTVGFFGHAPVTKPNVTGAKGGNAALTSLLTQLASLGLITDSTT